MVFSGHEEIVEIEAVFQKVFVISFRQASIWRMFWPVIPTTACALGGACNSSASAYGTVPILVFTRNALEFCATQVPPLFTPLVSAICQGPIETSFSPITFSARAKVLRILFISFRPARILRFV
jgi:hypothetical protein